MDQPLDAADLFDTPAATRRIPRDSFERALFRAAIMRAVEGWAQRTYAASVGHEAHADGTWTLRLAERRERTGAEAPATVGALDVDAWPRSETGTIWLGERDGRPVVCWAIAGQANADAAPVSPWGLG